MDQYETLLVKDLRKLIDADKYKEDTGILLAKAKRADIVEYLRNNPVEQEQKHENPFHHLPEPPPLPPIKFRAFNPQPAKVSKDFVPDQNKLQEIRSNVEQPEPVVYNVEIDSKVRENLGEDVVNLSSILGKSSADDYHDTDNTGYAYDESKENKIREYVKLYPTLKPIASSPEFTSSEEKLIYIEHHLDSSRFNIGLTNWFFCLTSYAEGNEAVNKYVKLKGYTARLQTRRQELETYIEEMKIKYMDEIGDCVAMPVEARIGILLAEVALQTHMENRKMEEQDNLIQAQQREIARLRTGQINPRPKPEYNVSVKSDGAPMSNII